MDIQISQIIFQIINFSVVVGALTFLLYKPVLKIFDERAKRIQEGQKAAEKAIASQEKLEEMKAKAEAEIKKERAEVLEKAQTEAKSRKQTLLAEAKKEAQAEVDKLKAQWQDEKAQMIKSAKADMADAVVQTAKVVIGKSLDTKDQKKLIDTELDNLLSQI